MEIKNAIDAFSALAQETRLSVFRLLVVAGADGMPAGAIAKELSAVPSTLSHHLTLLERAGLLRSWRVQRQIFYAADYSGVGQVIEFLLEDCCDGRPEVCGSLSSFSPSHLTRKQES
jgi:ArsR family transcriptional regulator